MRKKDGVRLGRSAPQPNPIFFPFPKQTKPVISKPCFGMKWKSKVEKSPNIYLSGIAGNAILFISSVIVEFNSGDGMIWPHGREISQRSIHKRSVKKTKNK
jgi:hypothetical protein